MKIKGTKYEEIEVRMDGSFFNKGDIIIDYYKENLKVLKGSEYEDHYLYTTLYPAMIGEELEVSIKHFKFLTKYSEYLSLI